MAHTNRGDIQRDWKMGQSTVTYDENRSQSVGLACAENSFGPQA